MIYSIHIERNLYIERERERARASTVRLCEVLRCFMKVRDYTMERRAHSREQQAARRAEAADGRDRQRVYSLS